MVSFTIMLTYAHSAVSEPARQFTKRSAKGSDIKRTSRRTVLLNKGNSAAIKAAKRSQDWKGLRTTTTTQRFVIACYIA